jgi:hypothetical protein
LLQQGEEERRLRDEEIMRQRQWQIQQENEQKAQQLSTPSSRYVRDGSNRASVQVTSPINQVPPTFTPTGPAPPERQSTGKYGGTGGGGFGGGY